MTATLTTAELQVLQYLPTRMSFDEIGTYLLAPRQSVKSQAIAVTPSGGVVAYWTDMREQACFAGRCASGEDAFFAAV